MEKGRSRRAIVAIAAALILAAMFAAAAADNQETVIDTVREGDLVFSFIRETGLSGDRVALTVDRVVEQGGRKRIYVNDFTAVSPWKLEIADIDGDQVNEVLAGVRKSTHFDHRVRNRLFIFNFDGEQLYKKWTGSQIAGDWNVFYAEDVLSIPGDELLFIERNKDGSEKISLYYWLDFGFVKLAESKHYRAIQNVSRVGKNLLQAAVTEAGVRQTRYLKVVEGEIVEEHSKNR